MMMMMMMMMMMIMIMKMMMMMMLMEIWNRQSKLGLQGNKKIQHYPTNLANLSPNKDYTYAKILKLPFFARTVHLAARRYNK